MESAWTPALEAGYAPIDAQHRQLVAVLDPLLAALDEGDGAEARSAAEALLAATRAHFEWEEARMPAGWEHARTHKADHAAFLAELIRLVHEISLRGASPVARLWGGGRFVEWFRFHTRAQDAGLGRLLRRAEEDAAAAAAPGGAPAARPPGPAPAA